MGLTTTKAELASQLVETKKQALLASPESVKRRRDDLVKAVCSDQPLSDIDGLNAKLRAVFERITLDKRGNVLSHQFVGQTEAVNSAGAVPVAKFAPLPWAS